jgi:hypothetical protein
VSQENTFLLFASFHGQDVLVLTDVVPYSCIHAFFVLRRVFQMCRGFSFTRTCPNCRAHVAHKNTRVSAEKPRDSSETEALYEPLDGPKYEDEGRVSSEADTLYRPSVDTLGSTETVLKLI